MNSFSTSSEPYIESELLDLGAVPFTTLRELDNDAVRHSSNRVVERARRVHARYRSGSQSGGERID